MVALMKTVLVLLLALTLPLTVSAQDAAPLAPKIVCPETVFDFGERENTGVVEHDYVVRNEGDLSLEIRNVRASCGCTVVKPAENVVPPGGETTIHARFDLRGRRGLQVKTIYVNSNDPESPTIHLQLRGTLVEGLRAQPSTLFFGRIGPNDQRSRPFEIISGRGPVQILEVRTSTPGLVVTPQDPLPDDDGSVHRFELSLADSLPEGTVNAQVVIQTDQDGSREVSIPVAAYIIAPPPEVPPAP